MGTHAIIETQELTKAYKGQVAVDKLSFSLKDGDGALNQAELEQAMTALMQRMRQMQQIQQMQRNGQMAAGRTGGGGMGMMARRQMQAGAAANGQFAGRQRGSRGAQAGRGGKRGR